MNKLESIKKCINRCGDFDTYYGIIDTDYGVSYYIGVNSMAISPKNLTYNGKCGVTARSANPMVSISAMELLFGKKEWIVEEKNGFWDVSENFNSYDLYDLNEDLLIRMVTLEKKDIVKYSIDMMNSDELEEIMNSEDEVESKMNRFTYIQILSKGLIPPLKYLKE